MPRKTAVLHFAIKKVTRINKAKKLSVSFSTSQGMYTEKIFKFHNPTELLTPNKTGKYVVILCSIIIKYVSR